MRQLQSVPIILASSSVQRQKLLTAMGLQFTTIPADIDEKAIRSTNLAVMAEKIATAKGEWVRNFHPEAIIIAADAFVALNGEIFEKPASLAEATEMLRKFSGQEIIEYTGMYLAAPGGLVHRTCVQTKAKFRKLTEAEIANYVTSQPVLTWSGSFSAAYDAGASLIANIEGSLTAFTHGICANEVAYFLAEVGQAQPHLA